MRDRERDMGRFRGAEQPQVPGRGVGQLRSPACWCRWSWGRSPRCSRRCIHQYLCKPASSAAGMVTQELSLPAALPRKGSVPWHPTRGPHGTTLTCLLALA